MPPPRPRADPQLTARAPQVESFWSLWTHLHPPSALLPTTDYLLFHSGVRRPVWEDPLNLPGGKWILRLRKGVADRVWEDLVLAIVGDQFADCTAPEEAAGGGGGGGAAGSSKADEAESWRSGPKDAKEGKDAKDEEWPDICGCTISVRQSEDIVSVWTRDSDVKVRERTRCVEPVEVVAVCRGPRSSHAAAGR